MSDNQNWYPDPRIEDGALFEIGQHKSLDDGSTRFELLIHTLDGDLLIKGFRFHPDTGEVLPPAYRMNGGFQPLVTISGPLAAQVVEEIKKQIASTEE